jgi:hypothetical protein
LGDAPLWRRRAPYQVPAASVPPGPHPRWRGTPVGVRPGALYAYRKVAVAWVYGFARLYSAPPGTPPPDPAVALEQQGWTELEAGDFLLPWLLHITMYELCERSVQDEQAGKGQSVPRPPCRPPDRVGSWTLAAS